MDLDPDTDPVIFVSVLQVFQQKIIIFCLLLFELKVHLHHFSQIKSHKEVKKQLESMFFLLFLLDDRRIRINIFDYWIRMRIRESQKTSYGSATHCLLVRHNLADGGEVAARAEHVGAVPGGAEDEALAGGPAAVSGQVLQGGGQLHHHGARERVAGLGGVQGEACQACSLLPVYCRGLGIAIFFSFMGLEHEIRFFVGIYRAVKKIAQLSSINSYHYDHTQFNFNSI
jgi:hypothetical protein